MPGTGADQGHDGPRAVRPWRTLCLVAAALCAFETLALCGLWFDGLVRIRNAERRLEDVARETTGMMMLLADLQDADERQKDWNRIQAEINRQLTEVKRK